MKVKVLKSAGLDEALLGLSLSYNSEPSMRVAMNLAHKQGGHNKFLESIMVWLDITAPRYWWQQFDTYRVGTTKQSESTMHTLTRKPLDQDDFEGWVSPDIIGILNKLISDNNLEDAKRNLPESFLQRRIVCTNCKVLQNMEMQRRSHKLPEWQFFLNTVENNFLYPEFIKYEEHHEFK